MEMDLHSEYDSSAAQEAALALGPGVTPAGVLGHDEDEEDDEVLQMDPAERRARKLQAAAERPPLYNADAMHEKLEDISWPSEVLLGYCPGDRTHLSWVLHVYLKAFEVHICQRLEPKHCQRACQW